MHSCCVSSIYDVNNVLCFCCPVFKFSRKSSFCKANRRWWPNRKWPQGSEWDAQHGIGCWTSASGRESSPQTLRGPRTQVWSSYLNETHKREWSRGRNDYTEIHKENKYLADYISNCILIHTVTEQTSTFTSNPKSTTVTVQSKAVLGKNCLLSFCVILMLTRIVERCPWPPLIYIHYVVDQH